MYMKLVIHIFTISLIAEDTFFFFFFVLLRVSKFPRLLSCISVNGE